MKYICAILMALVFVACDKNAESSLDSALDSANLDNAKSFDFGALKAEAEAQEIDLSKIVLADSAKNADSALDSAKNVDSANSAQHTKSSGTLVSTPQITKSMAKFYLLEGEIEGQSATLYLKIASARDDVSENQSNALAYITGKIVRGAEIYTLEGEVENAEKPLALEISNASDKRQIFEAQIAPNGEVSGRFIGEEFFKNEAIFKRAQGKINEIAIFGVSVAQKHKGKDFDGKDRDFDYNVSMQIPRISVEGKMSIALDKINGALREMAMPDLIDGEDSTNFNSVSTFDVDYIDEKIIVLDNYKYFYSGGAHGIYSDEAISFDLKNGERNDDIDALLKDKNDPALLKMVRERLKAEYEDSVDENAELTRFRIRPNGVEFFWGVYEIAPYAVGIVRINFTFAELAEFVKEDSIYAYLFKA